MKKTAKYRGKSIARRLNAALTRRSFAKTVLIDILASILILFTWCVTIENSSGGKLWNVSSRRFTFSSNIIYNTLDFFDDLSTYVREIRQGLRPEFSLTLPFDGAMYSYVVRNVPVDTSESTVETVYAETDESGIPYVGLTTSEPDGNELNVTYRDSEGEIPTEEVRLVIASDDGETEPAEIEVPEEEYYYIVDSEDIVRVSEYVNVVKDASEILTVLSCGFVILFVCQVIMAIIRGFIGGGLIKRYLRPIDDIAMMAEQLSSDPYSYAEPVKTTVPTDDTAAENVEQNETILDMKDVESLADAIDGIADSRARIEVQASELGGLEAAINNMLKRLEESRRGQIRFVDDASHELRTPVAVIQGYANMLDRWGKDDPEVRDEAIAAIKNEAEHIKILLDQLLFLARGDMERHAFETAPVSVDILLDEIAEESKMLDKDHTYEIITPQNGEDGSGGIVVNADYAMLKQCVRILCDNATKYTPAGGTITLKCEERVSADDRNKIKKEVCIEVADTGIGISPEELPRIFDRFYRGENARADNTGGSGLGLSIARWIAEQHRGRIEAISSLGIGTKMTVIIPGE